MFQAMGKLEETIRAEVRRRGRLTFAEFMDMALTTRGWGTTSPRVSASVRRGTFSPARRRTRLLPPLSRPP